MTDKLPPNLAQLFHARPPLRYLRPCDQAPEERTTAKISGLAEFLPALKEETEPYKPTESWFSKQQEELYDKIKAHERLAKGDIKDCSSAACSHLELIMLTFISDNPKSNPKATENALKTLFVARLPYDVTQQDLEHVFGRFGAIREVCNNSRLLSHRKLIKFADCHR